MPDSDVIEKVRTDTRLDGGDGEERDRQSHVIDTRLYNLTDAVIFGTPVTALCGKTWVPSRDPKKYPLCQTCAELAQQTFGRIPES